MRRTCYPKNRSPGQRITPIQWVGLGVLILLVLWQMGLLDMATGGLGGLQSRIPFFVALVVAITVHEFSHGLRRDAVRRRHAAPCRAADAQPAQAPRSDRDAR